MIHMTCQRLGSFGTRMDHNQPEMPRVVAALREAGALILGKSNLHELALRIDLFILGWSNSQSLHAP